MRILTIILITIMFAMAITLAGNEAPGTKISAEYAGLLGEVLEYNANGIDSWTMNSEHLFSGTGKDGNLRDRAISFIRHPGALDLVFGRIRDPATSDAEVLADVEMLVYYGQYHLDGDDALSSEKAEAVWAAVKKGRLSSAEKKYPEAPIRRQLSYAIDKSQRNAKPATTQP